MTERLNLLGSGQVIPTALHAEMEQSYLEYAMSVIVGRALPDARDGLKPVHRRILYAMHELGLTPDRPFRKCARVVGDVLGKYHPHGDQAVYDALVRMVQTFSSRYPLLAGHGNFGSLDNDPPAAMRYTETRLAAIAHEGLLDSISEATVDFIGNFDNSQQEPVVLPARLPFLLLNGCTGIAVGMATNVPPHNLGELVDGAIALVDRPTLSDEKLFELIPGPDFPTGGEIVDLDGVRDAYRTGRGTIKVRGITSVERLRAGRRRQRTAIIVTELPYQTNKAGWIEKVAELVNAGRLDGISDLRDESDRDGMRVVVELKRDADPDTIRERLFSQTTLQSNFGAIVLALIEGSPQQLSLREALQAFLTFREETLTRQYANDLEAAERRLHIAEGLLLALDQLDAAIAILRGAADGSAAKAQMQEQFGISDTQADAILAMPLRRLTGLERQKLETEAAELREQIDRYQLLLSDRRELLKALKAELRSLKRKFSNPRRTRICRSDGPEPDASPTDPPPTAAAAAVTATTAAAESATDPTPRSKPKARSKPKSDPRQLQLDTTPRPERAAIAVTRANEIYWHTDPPAPPSTGDDIVTLRASTETPLVTLTDAGKAHLVNRDAIPPAERAAPLATLLQGAGSKGATPVFTFPWTEELAERDLILLAAEGKIKRTPLSDLDSLSKRGLSAIALKSPDTLAAAAIARPGDNIVLATSSGRALRLPLDDDSLTPASRSARGNQIARLSEKHGEIFVGCLSVAPDAMLVLLTCQGSAKRLPLAELPFTTGGSFGARALTFTDRQDRLRALLAAPDTATIAIATDRGRALHVAASEIALWDRDGTGDRLSLLSEGEAIVGAVIASD